MQWEVHYREYGTGRVRVAYIRADNSYLAECKVIDDHDPAEIISVEEMDD